MRCATAAQDSVQAAARIQSEILSAQLGDYQWSLRHFAPLVEATARPLLQDGGQALLDAIDELPSAQHLSALAYAGGLRI